jgi:membrane-associated phospholipid phosphatase
MSLEPKATRQPGLRGPLGLFQALLAPTPNHARVIWTAAIGVIVIIIVGLIIRSHQLDFVVVQFMNGYHHNKIGSITNAVYKIFGPGPAIAGTIALTAIILALTRNLRVASTFAATIAATWLSLAAVKLIVHRIRPDASLLPFPFNPAQVDASYPSGHAAFVTALVVTVVLGAAAGRNRIIAAIVGGFLVIGVGTSLVIDGVHFPSDVIASILWGIAVAPFARMVWVSVILRGFDTIRTRRGATKPRA